MVLAHQAGKETRTSDLRYPYGRGGAERKPMYASYYRRPPTWADYVVDPLIWGLKAVSQRIDDGVSKVVVAVSIVVISAVILGVGGMAVKAYFGMDDIQRHIQSIDEHMKSIDQRLGAGNGHSAGP